MKTKTLMEEPRKKEGRILPELPAGAMAVEEKSAKGALGREIPGIGEIHPLPLEEVISRIEERLDDC
jgi:hypothetical protein